MSDPELNQKAEMAEPETAISGLPAATPDHDPIPLSQLQISVDVCLPSQKVALSDISNWMKGGLVPLPALPLAAGMPIEVRHGTQVLATGSLVLLDDCYAVHIDKVMVTGS